MTGRARAHRCLAAALAACVLAPALLTGCAQSVDPIERLGRKAAQKVPPKKPVASPSCGQAFREASGASPGGTATSPAGPPETGQSPVAEKERPTPEKRCPDGRRGVPAPPRGTPSP